jgi:NitT/TauT family transport system substrate-binding protein
MEATLITDLIRRDLPYYDASISPAMVRRMTQFSRDVGILQGDPDCRDLVAAPARIQAGLDAATDG